jgi:hypothetical protein
MNNLQLKYHRDGYVIAHSEILRSQILALKSTFEEKFQRRFGNDLTINRNLIKRFADSIEIANLFASPELIAMIRSLGLISPVYCGPVVSHYTHSDVTGNSYGLPWHQDFPSMASSSNAIVVWVSVNLCNIHTHSLEVGSGLHAQGLLPGEQLNKGYILSDQNFADSNVLDIMIGDVLIFSPFLPHRTYVNPLSTDYKLSFSRRFDDLECPKWAERKFVNAFGVSVDRELYTNSLNS